MPLLLLDLDNTLIDREVAFAAAVTELLAAHSRPADDRDWILRIDKGGYASRADVLQAMLERYGDAIPEATLRDFLRWGAADQVRPDHAVNQALRRARAAGWTPVVVTNGAIEQQTKKIRGAGLDDVVGGWVISEAVGHRKPEPQIFQLAAEQVGGELDDAWMIGDAAIADIGGANALGLPNVWLARGRTWPTELDYRPTHVTEDVCAAIELATTS